MHDSPSNDSAEHGESLAEQLQFERLLAELSAAFVNIPGERLDSELHTWLERIGKQLDVDLCTIWQAAEDGENFNVTHICSTLGSAVFPPKLPYTAFPYATKRLFSGEIVVFSCVDDLPAEAENEKQLIHSIGLKSTAAFPLAASGSYIGAVTFGTLNRERIWSESLLRRLRLVGEIFANALVLRKSQEAIRRERDRANQYLNIAGTILVALDGEQRVTMVNEKGCKLLGYTESEIIGQNWFDTLIPASIRETVRKTFVPLMTGEKEPALYYENAVLTKAGEERLIAWSNTLLRDDHGAVIGTLSSGEDITERRAAEKAIRDSEERFRVIYESSPIAIEIYDREGRLLDVNRACLEMFGVSGAEVVRGFVLFDDPNLPEGTSEKLRRGESIRYVSSFNFEKVKALGLYPTTRSGTVYLDVEIVPLSRESDSSSIGYLVQIQDITERRLAEEAIRESEERLAKMFRSSPALISISSLDENKFTEVNETFLSVLGFQRDEVIGCSVADINLFVDPGTRDEIIREVKERGFVRGMHVRARTRRGEILDGLLSAESIEVRGYRYLLSVATDITEQRRMERALRKSKERFERVTQESREMVWEVDTEGLFTYVNAACEQILGYRPDEMIGKMHFYDLHPEREREKFKRESFKQIARRSSFHNSVNEAVTKDGRQVWFLTSGAPLFDESGNLEGYTGADLDITERKRAEEALRESEERFLKAFNCSPAMMSISTIEEGKFLEVNTAFLTTLGYQRDDVIGRSSGELHIFEDPRQREFIKQSVKKQRYLRNMETAIRLRSGEVRECLYSAEIVELSGKEYLLSVVSDVTERKRFGSLLRYAVEGTSAAIGTDFFRSMVSHLATALEVRYALIGEVEEPDFDVLSTIAIWSSGRAGRNFQHTLIGGPCEDIFSRPICLYPTEVRGSFPNDRLLAELEVDSLLGIPLQDSSGRPLGILAVMNDKPFAETMLPHAVALVSIFAARAAAELERLHVEEELQKTTDRLKVEREELAEKNVALKQILGHLEREKVDYKHEISASVDNLLMPYLRKLRSGAGRLKPRELDALQNALESIVGKDIDQFRNNFARLTPRERDICERIKAGLTSKQIAAALNIDVLTVHKHRDAIRRKLQLKHKDLNLTSYLRAR